MLAPDFKSSFAAYFLPQYLQLNDAIKQLTADMAAHDPGVFRGGGGDVRYVAERQLFFALFASKELFDYFVVCQTGTPLPDENSLSIWVRCVAPYFRGERRRFDAPDFRTRFLRSLYRRSGQPSIRSEGFGAERPRVFFHVIHPKFIRYLAPIAEKLSVPYAFLTIEHPEMFDVLAGLNLPRLHIELTAKSQAMATTEVDILGSKFNPGFFDSWIIRLNAVRRALKELKPDCVVVPEGNAAFDELVNQSAKAIGVRTVCVQQGWAPVVHPGFRNMSYDAMCVWGEKFASMLAPFNPRQRFIATGNHVISCQPQGNISDRRAIAFFLQNGAHWMTDEVWQGMLDFIIWTANSFPDREIRVREHPGVSLSREETEHLSAAANVKLMVPGRFTLNDVFSGCRVAIAINSTTILEAIAGGVVPLILDVGGFGKYFPDVAGEGAAIEVKEFAAARTALERLVADDAFCASFAGPLELEQRSLFARHGEQALKAIVAEIEGPVSGDPR
jgi:hypothetical protein